MTKVRGIDHDLELKINFLWSTRIWQIYKSLVYQTK